MRDPSAVANPPSRCVSTTRLSRRLAALAPMAMIASLSKRMFCSSSARRADLATPSSRFVLPRLAPSAPPIFFDVSILTPRGAAAVSRSSISMRPMESMMASMSSSVAGGATAMSSERPVQLSCCGVGSKPSMPRSRCAIVQLRRAVAAARAQRSSRGASGSGHAALLTSLRTQRSSRSACAESSSTGRSTDRACEISGRVLAQNDNGAQTKLASCKTLGSSPS